MKKVASYLWFLLIILFILNGCGSNNNNTNENEDLSQYEGTSIGNNSAVIHIIDQLKHGEEFKEVSLETNTEPYGMTIKYEDIEAATIEKEYKETAIYNATFLFAFIKNAEWTTFHFSGQQYNITKTELQDWYGKELSKLTSEDELKNLTQEQLKDESKVNQFFEK